MESYAVLGLVFFFFLQIFSILKFSQNKFLFKKNVLFVFCMCFTPQGSPNRVIHHIHTFESQDLTFLRHFHRFLSQPILGYPSLPAITSERVLFLYPTDSISILAAEAPSAILLYYA